MSKKQSLIDLSGYYEVNEQGEKVLKSFTESKDNESVLAVIIHNKGAGPVIDVFIGMYQEYLRQQWFHIATDYNERLQAVWDWNADKPQIGEDEKGDPVYPEDRVEPDPPEQTPIPTVDEYKQQYTGFITSSRDNQSRSKLYSEYAIRNSWTGVNQALFANVSSDEVAKAQKEKILADTFDLVQTYNEQKELGVKTDITDEQYKQTLTFRQSLREAI